MNHVEFHICHNFGLVVARCRSRMFQANNCHIERSSNFRYFKGYYFSSNVFGHKAIDFYKRKMKQIICYACNKFGYIANECKRKFWPTYQKGQTSSHSKVWKKNEL